MTIYRLQPFTFQNSHITSYRRVDLQLHLVRLFHHPPNLLTGHILPIRNLLGERPLLHHNSHNLIQHIRRRHGRQLGIRIIRRRHLDQIRRHEINPLQPADNCAQLARRPASGLGRARRGRERRIQSVDVDGQVDWAGGADAVADPLDDAGDAERVDLAGLDAREAAVAVVGVVARATQCSADAGVDGTVVGEKAFFGGPVEVRAVVYGCLLGGGAAKDLGLPGVEVRVEVDDGDGAVGFVDGAEEGQGYGVVAS